MPEFSFHLFATDGTARGAAIGEGLAYLIDARNNDAGRSALRLAGSVVLATTGFVAGRPLSDGEAHGATWGSTYAGAVSAGVIGLAGGWSSGGNKGEVAATVGAALLGYPFGLHWVRRSRYAITSGDVSAIRTAALLGTAAAATALDSDANDRLVAGLLTSGFVLGSGVGAAAVARKFDLTESQANQVNLGTIAGGLTGLVLPTLAQARDGRAFFLAGAIGGAIGMAVTLNMVDPRPGAGRRVSTSRRVRFTPLGVLGLAGGRPAGDPGLRRATVFRVSF